MKGLLRSICDEAIKRGASFADVRVFESENTGILRQDGRADKLNQGAASGLGVRVLKDHAWGFASVSDVAADTAMAALAAAISMAEASSVRSEESSVAHLKGVEDKVAAVVELDPRSVGVERKMAALEGYDAAAVKIAGDKLANLIVSYSDVVQKETVCNTFGAYIENESIRTILHASITVKDGAMLQRSSARAGQPLGFELVEKTSAEEFTVKAARTALSLLSATPPPAGKFPIIFHPSITGLLTHEAIGHNAEADAIIGGTSIIGGKMGEKIASEWVTIVDDSTIPGKWGTFKYDSEGTPSTRRVLIDKGVLRGYMHSLETAARLGLPPNGSARAQDYHNRPIVRIEQYVHRAWTIDL